MNILYDHEDHGGRPNGFINLPALGIHWGYDSCAVLRPLPFLSREQRVQEQRWHEYYRCVNFYHDHRCRLGFCRLSLGMRAHLLPALTSPSVLIILTLFVIFSQNLRNFIGHQWKLQIALEQIPTKRMRSRMGNSLLLVNEDDPLPCQLLLQKPFRGQPFLRGHILLFKCCLIGGLALLDFNCSQNLKYLEMRSGRRGLRQYPADPNDGNKDLGTHKKSVDLEAPDVSETSEVSCDRARHRHSRQSIPTLEYTLLSTHSKINPWKFFSPPSNCLQRHVFPGDCSPYCVAHLNSLDRLFTGFCIPVRTTASKRGQICNAKLNLWLESSDRSPAFRVWFLTGTGFAGSAFSGQSTPCPGLLFCGEPWSPWWMLHTPPTSYPLHVLSAGESPFICYWEQHITYCSELQQKNNMWSSQPSSRLRVTHA